MSTASDLCAACGMCCDGTLFYSAELQAMDDPKVLLSLGLKMHRKKGHYSLLQPCPAHKENCCSIYALRPERCRKFECRQLILRNEGTISDEQALAVIGQARTLLDEVVSLLVALGETNSRRNLARRCDLALTRFFDPEWEQSQRALQERLRSKAAAFEHFLKENFRVE